MENNYAEETQFLSDEAAGKSRFRELSTEETKVKGKCHTNSDKKKTANVRLKLFNGTCLRGSPYKFKEIN